ncbi:MAG: hypothetical protein VZQ75_00285 [Candidatus Faecousia sp.]|nr:hypothetical protein [Candidatus Faecousia sp.]
MAERRMFARTIVLSDAFLDMSLGARCLYMTLGMVADDDGFVNNPKSVMRQCGAQEDDLKILLAKKFLIPFDSGIVVIKHWRINNYLQKDRYHETKYGEEKASLEIEPNGAYHLIDPAAEPKALDTPPVYTDSMYTEEAYTQVRLGKDSIGKVGKDKDIYSLSSGSRKGGVGGNQIDDIPTSSPPDDEKEKDDPESDEPTPKTSKELLAAVRRKIDLTPGQERELIKLAQDKAVGVHTVMECLNEACDAGQQHWFGLWCRIIAARARAKEAKTESEGK